MIVVDAFKDLYVPNNQKIKRDDILCYYCYYYLGRWDLIIIFCICLHILYVVTKSMWCIVSQSLLQPPVNESYRSCYSRLLFPIHLLANNARYEKLQYIRYSCGGYKVFLQRSRVDHNIPHRELLQKKRVTCIAF